MKEIKYDRGDLLTRIVMVLFLGICMLFFLLVVYHISDLGQIGWSDFGLLLPCALLWLIIFLTIRTSLKMLRLPFAVKFEFEDEKLVFSGQALPAVKLEELDFISYDETFSGKNNTFQILLGFSDEEAELLPQKVQKKLLETQVGQKMLVLNFALLDSKSWHDFWTRDIFPEESKFIDSIVLDKRGLLAQYKQGIVDREILTSQIAAFIVVVFLTVFVLGIIRVDGWLQFDIFH
jgi:hypothetical protein